MTAPSNIQTAFFLSFLFILRQISGNESSNQFKNTSFLSHSRHNLELRAHFTERFTFLTGPSCLNAHLWSQCSVRTSVQDSRGIWVVFDGKRGYMWYLRTLGAHTIVELKYNRVLTDRCCLALTERTLLPSHRLLSHSRPCGHFICLRGA